MNLTPISAPDFDLAATLDSGQVFHWEKHGAGFVGTIGERAVYLEQRGDKLFVTPEAADVVPHYFALDHPLREICAAVSGRSGHGRGAQLLRGLAHHAPAALGMSRVVHHLLDETGGAHPADVARVAGTLRDAGMIYGSHVYAFPSAARLARATEKELRACALGYRAKNLLATAQRVASGEADLEAWRALADEELRAAALRAARRGREGG